LKIRLNKSEKGIILVYAKRRSKIIDLKGGVHLLKKNNKK
jgi:hypothetical protein